MVSACAFKRLIVAYAIVCDHLRCLQTLISMTGSLDRTRYPSLGILLESTEESWQQLTR